MKVVTIRKLETGIMKTWVLRLPNRLFKELISDSFRNPEAL